MVAAVGPADGRCVVGVDLGGTKLLAGALGADLEVRDRTRRSALGLDQEGLLDELEAAVRAVVATVEVPIDAVGFGVPCTFDRRTGVAVQAVNLPLRDVRVAQEMQERLGFPTVADNDANCAALAEARLGAGRGSQHVVMLTLGTGIGSGMVLDGRLYRGAVGAAPELGHMVVDMDGPPCQGNCPNHGCLEAVASGTALLREAAEAAARRPSTPLGRALALGEPLSGPLIDALALEGDPVAREAIETIGARLGVGLANIANIFNPEVIVIGGGVVGAGEMLLGPARAAMRERALSPARDLARVEAAAFGAEAGMVGAALLAVEETVRS